MSTDETAPPPDLGTDVASSRRPGVDPLGYRPALDGWRGIGILAVMAYHAGLRTVIPGAFLWIDGFFTVSAFLIATLLLEERTKSGGVSLTGFWARRIRRLGPALLVTLVGMLGFARIADRAQLAALPQDVLATLFYVANWRSVLAGNDYFSAFANESPLKHTWSLAIEEQFYVVFPLLLVALISVARRTQRHLASILFVVSTVGIAISAGWMAWLHAGGATTSRLYYGTDTRAQSLLVGVALAAWRYGALRRDGAGRATPSRPGLTVGAGLACFLVLAGAQFVVRDTTSALYAGGFLVAALMQATVFRAALVPGPFASALAWRPLVWVGGMAYGLYLFHFPIFLWLDAQRIGTDGPLLFGVRFSATFAVAIPVLYLVEQPIRSRRWPARGTVVAKAAWPIAIAAIAAVALLAPVPTAAPEESELVAMVVPPSRPPRSTTSPSVTASTEPGTDGSSPGTDPTGDTEPPPVEPKAPPRVAVVGDSTGTALSIGIEAWAKGTGAIVFAGDGARVGCPLGRGGAMHTAADLVGDYNPACDWDAPSAPGFDGIVRPAWPTLVRDWKPDLIVVSFGPWDIADHRIPGDPTWRFPGDPVYDEWLRDEMEDAFEILTAGGGHLVWLTQPPWLGLTRRPPAQQYAPAADPGRMDRLNELIREVAAEHPDQISVVDLADWMATSGDDARLRPDGAHLEPAASVEVLNRFLGEQLVLLWDAL